jgi:phosphoribosyl 1,2-cyclic phosphodiesterase
MEVRFWGVRGSIATSGAAMANVGGNTSCIEVRSQGERLILDAGTGIRALGEELLREGPPLQATLLFSHLHWDHVQGFPFFTPAYLPTTSLRLVGPGPEGASALERVLREQMTPPTFPVPLSTMRGQLAFSSALPGQPFEQGPFRIIPIALRHPNGCLGYRIEADGAAFVYATDVEVSSETLSSEVQRDFDGADALCLDAQYTPEEYRGERGVPKRGWGHSTMMDAAQVAACVSAQRLLLFHHDPARTDDAVEHMAEQARTIFAPSEPAREGKRIFLGEPPRAAV